IFGRGPLLKHIQPGGGRWIGGPHIVQATLLCARLCYQLCGFSQCLCAIFGGEMDGTSDEYGHVCILCAQMLFDVVFVSRDTSRAVCIKQSGLTDFLGSAMLRA